MAMAQGYIAVGVFQDSAQAQEAIQELRQAGYNEDEIGYLARVGMMESDETTGSFIATSAVEGGLVGGLLGAALALFIPGFGPAVAGGILAAEIGGVALGAAAGGFIGSMISIGIPEEEVRHYQKELEAGHIVVTVMTKSGYDEALDILRRCGAHDVTTRLSIFNAGTSFRS